MVRNAGKFGKPKRGGKKQFTQNLDEGDRAGMWDEEKNGSGSEEESSEDDSKKTESEEESEEEEEDEDGAVGGSKLKKSIKDENNVVNSSNQTHDSILQSRSERKKAKNQKKKKSGDHGDDDDDSEKDDAKDLENLNRATKKSLKLSEISKLDVGTPNRKEREAAEKKAAQERYWKLHQAGKTDEAKTDLARLAKIRQEREQAAAFRKAELEAKAKEASDRAALSGLTPASNLKKTGDMAVGQVSFHSDKLVKRVHVATRVNAIVNRLNKTKIERTIVDLEQEKIQHEKEMNRRKREIAAQKAKEEQEKQARRKAEQEARSYSTLFAKLETETFKDKGEKVEGFDSDEDFM